jgi:hypothetical protein
LPHGRTGMDWCSNPIDVIDYKDVLWNRHSVEPSGQRSGLLAQWYSTTLV